MTIKIYPTPQENEKFIETIYEVKLTLKQDMANKAQGLVEFINQMKSKVGDIVPSSVKYLFKVTKLGDVSSIDYLRFNNEWNTNDEPQIAMYYFDANANEKKAYINLVQLSVLYEAYYTEYDKYLKIC